MVFAARQADGQLLPLALSQADQGNDAGCYPLSADRCTKGRRISVPG